MSDSTVHNAVDRMSQDYCASFAQDTPEAELPLEEEVFFIERLKVFYEQSLTEIRAFAQREGRSYEQVRRQISELHCQVLFGGADGDNPSTQCNDTTSTILISISSQLESLHSICGHQSFYLVVDPSDPSNEGFLGGTLLGREFWRDHRGCGAPGAKAFALLCQRALQARPQAHRASPMASTSRGASQVQQHNGGAKKSSEIKAEVYLAVRNAVRAASNNRHAEMKWSNHANLSTYDVELIGWPPSVPKRNPSALSVAQNQTLLDALRNRTMWFRSTNPQPIQSAELNTQVAEELNDEAIFDEAIDFTGAAGGYEDGTVEHTGTICDRGSLGYNPGAQRLEQESEGRKGSPDRHLDFSSSYKKRRREDSEDEMLQSGSGGVK